MAGNQPEQKSVELLSQLMGSQRGIVNSSAFPQQSLDSNAQHPFLALQQYWQLFNPGGLGMQQGPASEAFPGVNAVQMQGFLASLGQQQQAGQPGGPVSVAPGTDAEVRGHLEAQQQLLPPSLSGLPSVPGVSEDEGGTAGAVGGEDAQDGPVPGHSVKCAKEKNRQAQRRFRERQKGLINNLKERADSLAKKCEEQARQIEALEKENQVLKVILQEKK